jgi:16S rRNA (cytosine1402-N4)-methyltransferase
MMAETLRHLGFLETETGPEWRPRVVADCTIGRGGHAERMVRALAAAGGGIFIGMDVDPENLKYARKRLENVLQSAPNECKQQLIDSEMKQTDAETQQKDAVLEPKRAEFEQKGAPIGVNLRTNDVRLRLFHANFGELEDVLAAVGEGGEGVKADALLADFGVSTNQLLDTKHGLSFNADVALDMRLDPRIRKKASDLVAELDEKELADILYEYAQERFAFRIARKIVQVRASEPIVTTGQLARLVRSVVPGKWGQIDPATRTFQALRMAVNTELEVIEELLAAVPGVMKPGGRCVFLSFHSGEDRLVKQALRGWEETGIAKALTKKPEEPSEEEARRNPRSRSAKLRAAIFRHADATHAKD